MKSRDAALSKRGDFLANYARIIHHQDSIKPITPPSAPLNIPVPRADRPATIPVTKGAAPAKEERPSAPKSPPPMALTAGMDEPSEKPTIGFAELLFRGTGEDHSLHEGHDWVKTAADAPPTIHPHESLLPPSDYVPLWLRSAVFIGGSIIVGAIWAHTSGNASWQKAKTSVPAANGRPASSATNLETSVPRAQPVPAAAVVAPPQAEPSIPQPSLPLEPSAPLGGLQIKPPAPLKELLTEPSGGRPAN